VSLSEKLAITADRAAERLDARAVLVVIACCACWGLNQVAVKIANAGISPILQVGLRSLLAGILVLAWSRARGVRLLERDGTLWAGLGAGLLFGGEFVVMYFGLLHTTASRPDCRRLTRRLTSSRRLRYRCRFSPAACTLPSTARCSLGIPPNSSSSSRST